MDKLDIIGRRKWFYIASAVVLIPGMIALLVWGLRLGIDFSGGSLLELRFEQEVSAAPIRSVLTELGFHEATVQISDDNTALIRTRTLELGDTDSTQEAEAEGTDDLQQTNPTAETGDNSEAEEADTEDQQVQFTQSSQVNEKNQIITALRDKVANCEEISFQSIGPTIGEELTKKAVYAVLVASAAIILYLAWSFRHVPKPASSLRFGICAIAALLHDVFFLLGIFALLGHFLAIEINGMFLVAALTVMGFSVHDSIVVFDRIRESLNKQTGKDFAVVVNDSILETMGRSINTTLTVLFTLLALFLFGGESIRVFTFALLIGTFSGAYSSIFNAAPLLVDWQNWSDSRAKKVQA